MLSLFYFGLLVPITAGYLISETLMPLNNRSSVCYGPGTHGIFRPACPNDSVIAIHRLMIGAKLKTDSCPQHVMHDSDGVIIGSEDRLPLDFTKCCFPEINQTDEERCTYEYDYQNTSKTEYYRNCSGYNECVKDMEVSWAPRHPSCSDKHMDNSNYMFLEYTCVNETRIEDICSNFTKTSRTGRPVYLQSPSYLSGISGTISTCLCHVNFTADSLTLNTLDVRLGYQQKLHVYGATNITYDSNNATVFDTTLHNLTSGFSVLFSNQQFDIEGHIWLGLHSEVEGHVIGISCISTVKSESTTIPSGASSVRTTGSPDVTTSQSNNQATSAGPITPAPTVSGSSATGITDKTSPTKPQVSTPSQTNVPPPTASKPTQAEQPTTKPQSTPAKPPTTQSPVSPGQPTYSPTPLPLQPPTSSPPESSNIIIIIIICIVIIVVIVIIIIVCACNGWKPCKACGCGSGGSGCCGSVGSGCCGSGGSGSCGSGGSGSCGSGGSGCCGSGGSCGSWCCGSSGSGCCGSNGSGCCGSGGSWCCGSSGSGCCGSSGSCGSWCCGSGGSGGSGCIGTCCGCCPGSAASTSDVPCAGICCLWWLLCACCFWMPCCKHTKVHPEKESSDSDSNKSIPIFDNDEKTLISEGPLATTMPRDIKVNIISSNEDPHEVLIIPNLYPTTLPPLDDGKDNTQSNDNNNNIDNEDVFPVGAHHKKKKKKHKKHKKRQNEQIGNNTSIENNLSVLNEVSETEKREKKKRRKHKHPELSAQVTDSTNVVEAGSDLPAYSTIPIVDGENRDQKANDEIDPIKNVKEKRKKKKHKKRHSNDTNDNVVIENRDNTEDKETADNVREFNEEQNGCGYQWTVSNVSDNDHQSYA